MINVDGDIIPLLIGWPGITIGITDAFAKAYAAAV